MNPSDGIGLPIAPPRLLRSAGVRFGVLYASLFGISAAALVLFLYWSTAGLLARETTAAINADAQGLAERFAQDGLHALEDTIEQRIAGNVDDDALYLLVDGSLSRVAGNLDRWPAGLAAAGHLGGGEFDLSVKRAGAASKARVHQYELTGGYRLLIGRDVQVRGAMQRLVTNSLIWAAGGMVVLGLVGALAMRGLFRLMVRDVARTAAAISAGDLTRRVPASGHGDEFDTMAAAINDMLDRIGRLMAGVKGVSNAIAHDLRTPIARARARLDDISRTPDATAEQLRAAVERAQADLDGITAVFQALLRISEIEAGARRSAFAQVDAVPLLADLGELYEAVAEERGVRLQLRLPARAVVLGDREMIQQAVANLLDNALKFSPEDGAVTLSAELARRCAGDRRGRSRAGDERGGAGAGDRAVLPRRDRAFDAGLRIGPVPGGGGGDAAWRPAGAGGCRPGPACGADASRLGTGDQGFTRSPGCGRARFGMRQGCGLLSS